MIKPLTNKIYHEITGHAPPYTLRGWAAMTGGVACGLGAVVLIEGVYFIICEIADTMPTKRDVVLIWRKIIESLNPCIEYYAIIDKEIETAPSLLSHCGFVHETDDIYRLT